MFIKTQLITFEEKSAQDRWKILSHCMINMIQKETVNTINNEKYLDMLSVSLQSKHSKLRKVAAFLLAHHLRYDNNSEVLTKKYGFCRKGDNMFLLNLKRVDRDKQAQVKS
jgi:hypothetical protein